MKLLDWVANEYKEYKLSEITEIECFSKDITDIEGIHMLKNLIYVNLSSNRIENVVIPYLPKLRYIDLYNNPIKEVEISETVLTDIKMSKCKLSEYPIIPDTAREVNLSYNNFKVAPSYTGVTKLYLHNNYISDIDNLNVMKDLKILDIQHNRITSLKTLHQCKMMESLDCTANRLESLDGIQNLENMELLLVSDNKLKDIREVSGLHKISEFYFNDNSITSVKELENLKKLIYFSYFGNEITATNLYHAVKDLPLVNRVMKEKLKNDIFNEKIDKLI